MMKKSRIYLAITMIALLCACTDSNRVRFNGQCYAEAYAVKDGKAPTYAEAEKAYQRCM